MEDRELALLGVRIDELIGRDGLTDARFLNLREQYFLREYMIRAGQGSRSFFWGGCADAERKMLFLLPDYVCDMADGMDEEEKYALAREMLAKELADSICPLRVTGSGYRSLSHRDYMGAVLALGVERFVIGDIVPEGEYAAILFTERKISAYLLSELTEVGADRVRIAEYELPADFGVGRAFRRLEDTVASARFDSVVASLISRSREAAKELIAAGGAEQNFAVCKKPDAPVAQGDVITVRGFGKFNIVSLSLTTKKGRLRLSADKYL